MRISEAEYQSLINCQTPEPPAAKKIIRQSTKQPNKLEKRFEIECLNLWKFEHKIIDYAFEAITIRIGNGVTYRPDYWTVDSEGRTTFYECKGKQVWDDAKVKIKVAAMLYPAYRFYLCRRENGAWIIDQVLS